MKIQLDMYQTIAAAVLVLMLGKYLKGKCSILEKFCIPAPVIGGVIFAVFTCICYVTGIAEFSFDDILKDVCMVFFFTSVGFQANLKVLKSGGKALIVFLGLVIGLIFCQNFLAVGLAKLLHQPSGGFMHWFHSDGGRPRNCRSFRTDSGGFRNLRSYDPLYRGRYLRPDCRQHDGRSFGKTSD